MRLRQSAALKRRGDVPVAYDDLDGSPIFEEVEVRRVSFGLDGVVYEMDLSQGHAAELVESLQPFIDVARVRKTSRGVRKPNRREKETGDDRMEQLAASEFYREHGHINVPSTLVIDGWNGGQWLHHLRRKYRRDALPTGVVERAEELGIDWNKSR